MNSFKLLVVFILLFLGSFAQRFQRHLFDGTQNGFIIGNSEMDNLDALSSDGDNYVQNGNDIKFFGNEREGIELELQNNELMFGFCSDGCMGKQVIACYDSTNSDSLRRGDCRSGQCMFKAGVKKTVGTNFLWFSSIASNTPINDPNGICKTAIMKHPEATPGEILPFPSCEPLKHDGNVVKLYVHQVPHGCSFYVLNAKKWIPSATIITSQNSSKFSESVKSSLKSSNTEIALWIIIGVVIFILLIVFIGFGYCYYRNEIQKKPHFGKKEEVQQSAFIPESKKAEVVKEKNAGEKEVLKPEPTKEATKEEATAAKEKLPESAKEKTPKEKKAIVETKPTKEVTQENVTKEDVPAAKKVSAEPTLEDSTVVKKSVVQQQQPGNLPRVFVPKKAILPAPKSINAPKSESYSSKKDSLSGRHKIGTQIMVVSSLDTLSGAGNDETQNSTRASEKLRKKESSGKGSKKHC